MRLRESEPTYSENVAFLGDAMIIPISTLVPDELALSLPLLLLPQNIDVRSSRPPDRPLASPLLRLLLLSKLLDLLFEPWSLRFLVVCGFLFGCSVDGDVDGIGGATGGGSGGGGGTGDGRGGGDGGGGRRKRGSGPG
jgi:uncharacterized membrane protein YgcG